MNIPTQETTKTPETKKTNLQGAQNFNKKNYLKKKKPPGYINLPMGTQET